MTLDEVLAKDKGLSTRGDPAQDFETWNIEGRPVRIYYSQPICWFDDGEIINLEDVVIKITDFGKG